MDGKDVSLSFPVNTASGGPITATATIPSDSATVGLHTLYCSSYSIVITATASETLSTDTVHYISYHLTVCFAASSATPLVSSTVGSVVMSDGRTSLATSEPSPSPSTSDTPGACLYS